MGCSSREENVLHVRSMVILRNFKNEIFQKLSSLFVTFHDVIAGPTFLNSAIAFS